MAGIVKNFSNKLLPANILSKKGRSMQIPSERPAAGILESSLSSSPRPVSPFLEITSEDLFIEQTARPWNHSVTAILSPALNLIKQLIAKIWEFFFPQKIEARPPLEETNKPPILLTGKLASLPLSEEEITFCKDILHTLANESLLSAQSLPARIAEFRKEHPKPHPLRTLAYTLSDPQMYDNVKIVCSYRTSWSSSIRWSKLSEQYSWELSTLKEEILAEGYLVELSTLFNLDSSLLHDYAHNDKWNDLLIYLVERTSI